MISTTTTITSV